MDIPVENNEEPEPRIPAGLAKEFSAGNGIIFVGAGLSIGAGLPSWSDLTKKLRAELDLQHATPIPSDVPPIKIAQFFINTYGQKYLVLRLREILGSYQNFQPTDVHRALVKLPAKIIYTTNFDTLIEEALRREKIIFDRVIEDYHVPLMSEEKCQLIKIHGDLEFLNTITFSVQDYNAFSTVKPLIANQLKAHLSNKTILFIGYRFADDDINLIMSCIKEQTKNMQGKLYCVNFDAHKLEIEDLKTRGIEAISFKNASDRNEKLRKWLIHLANKIESEKNASLHPGLSNRPVAHNIPLLPPGMVGQYKVVSTVLKYFDSESIASIEGHPGSGKTIAALQVGHSCSGRPYNGIMSAARFEGVVWISAKNKMENKRWLSEVLNSIGRVLGLLVVSQQSEEKLEEKAQNIRKYLATHTILIIIDNFETIDDPALIGWLNCFPTRSKLLITSTRRVPLEKCRHIKLQGLEQEDAFELIRRQQARNEEVELPVVPPTVLLGLYGVTRGNPQLIKQAYALMQSTEHREEEAERIMHRLLGKKEFAELFDNIYDMSWNKISLDAKRILMTVHLFEGANSFSRKALQFISGMDADPNGFAQGLAECESFLLIEERNYKEQDSVNSDGRYGAHSTVRAFAKRKLLSEKSFHDESSDRFIKYYLRHVREKTIRKMPGDIYWNSLVSDQMIGLEKDWSCIKEAMKISFQRGLFDLYIDFVMCLVHFMDSRLLNQERLEVVKRAVEVCGGKGRYLEEALFRIDALGWTAIEEGNLREGSMQIEEGARIANLLEDYKAKSNLLALAQAWRARILMEQEGGENPNCLLKANEIIQGPFPENIPAWIGFRIEMVAGDIAMRRGMPENALEHYKRQSGMAISYGGEGHGYQCHFRLGVAYLGCGEIDKARQEFVELSKHTEIPIGELYAMYGLALIEYKAGNKEMARSHLVDIREMLSLKTMTNNMLWKLADGLYRKLD